MKRWLLSVVLAFGCSKQEFGAESEAEAEAESEGEACEPGEHACDEDGNVTECGKDGTWEFFGSCTGGRECMGGVCKVPPACPSPGARQCDEDGRVVECNADQSAWDIVETCGEGEDCADGGCFGLCDLAKSESSFIACEFYTYSLDNTEVATGYYIIAANPNDEPTTVTVEQRSGDTWSVATTMSVAPSTISNAALTPRNVADTGLSVGAAYRVTSTLPVLAYQLNGYVYGSGGGSSSGATLLIPTPALGTKHFGVTMQQGNGTSYYGGTTRANLVVVGTEDATNLFVRASATGEIYPGTGLPDGLSPGETGMVSLDAGDVFQMASANPDDDLTGTYMEADKKVAVFGGHENGPPTESATYPLDHYEDSLPSVDKWGTEFVAAKIVGTENPSSAPAWRIVASEDDTVLTFEAGAGTTGLPDGTVVLGEGEWFETRANGNFHMITSSADPDDPDDELKPVIMVQFVTADTDMVLVPPVQQWLPEYVFANFAGGEVLGTITVARPAGTETFLDGGVFTATWSDAGGGYEVAQTSNPVGSHVISVGDSPDPGEALQIWMRGNQGGCTFSWVGGMNLAVINIIE